MALPLLKPLFKQKACARMERGQGGDDMNTHLMAILTIVVLGFGAWIVGQ
jgi:hypothetical protein